VAGSAVPPRPIVEAHIHPVGAVADRPATLAVAGTRRNVGSLPSDRTNRNRSSVAATALQTPLGAISEGGPQVDEHDADAGVPSA
jgi:hypothetical protein